MKKFIKRLLKLDERGFRLSEEYQEAVDNEAGNLTETKVESLPACRNCGRVVEPNQRTTFCPICNGPCCDFCHTEQLKADRDFFERSVIVERERLRWLEPKTFDSLPGIDIARKIAGVKSLTRLERLRKKLLGRRRDEWCRDFSFGENQPQSG